MIRLLRSLTAAIALAGAAAAAGPVETLNYGRFGAVQLYRGAGEPRDVALLVSGAAGWNAAAGAMAERLTAHGAIVAGIDLRRYQSHLERASTRCVSPAVDFENLSHYLQAKLGIRQYLQPTLVGYFDGAALVYATLAAAPDGLFKGALTIGFCPQLALGKPICKGSGLVTAPSRHAAGTVAGQTFLPAKSLSAHWLSLQADEAGSCPPRAAEEFIARVPGAESIPAAAEDVRMGQFETAFARLAAAHPAVQAGKLPEPVADLPLTLVPAVGASQSTWFGIFLSGDGGWVGLDRGVSQQLAEHGIPIVGWDSLKYFWVARTPAGAAGDLDRVLQHFSREWGKSHALLIGYSQGADTLPFMVNRLPAETHALVGLTALLGLSERADFEFHITNWLGNPSGGLPTAPELARWSGSPFVCIYGEDDGDSACDRTSRKAGIAIKMPGGHHFGGSYPEIAAEILRRLPQF